MHADDEVRHATLTFERRIAAPPARVFAALADPVARAEWGAPNDTTTLVYDETDFAIDGHDVFRCGSRDLPQFSGRTHYLDIVDARRIVASETIDSGGRRRLASQQTTQVAPRADGGTDLRMTIQVVAFGDDSTMESMIGGMRAGTEAVLDNLTRMLSA